MKKIVIAGSGSAALCAGIAALEQGADVLILEKAGADEAGGNSRYTAGAMRFAYQSRDELIIRLLRNPDSEQLDGVDADRALHTMQEFNTAVDPANVFDPTILDGRCTSGLVVDKTNWANRLDTPPFRAFPVTCGITFTYAGLRVDIEAAVLNRDKEKIPGLYACGEMIGGVFSAGYPGGSGLTSGAVFGRIAGRSAARARR